MKKGADKQKTVFLCLSAPVSYSDTLSVVDCFCRGWNAGKAQRTKGAAV